jgi:hypothetical protein
VLYLLRVSVVDRPGALGALASAIGEAGGDIAAIDVVERSSSSAVDDILVDAVDEAAVRRILESVATLFGVVVEACQPFTEGDQLGDGLDIVAALGSSGSRALTAVTRIAPATVRARWVVIVDEVSGGVAITHASVGAPWGRWTKLPWLPLTVANAVASDPSWLPLEWGANPQMAAAPLVGTQAVLLAIRPDGPQFRHAEIARLANLAAIAALVGYPTAHATGSISNAR